MELTNFRPLLHTALFLSVVSWSALAEAQTAPAQADSSGQSREQAIARFQRGLELYDEQDFNAALIEFRKAYELAPNYRVLYNIGQVCFQLQDYACALKSFESYLFEGASELPAERRAEVNRELAKLRPRVARLEVTTNVPDAEVAIDDVAIGHTPLPTTVVVSAGKRRVSASKPGWVPITRTVDVPGAETLKVSLVLVEQQAQVQFVERPSRMTKYSWIGVASAGALGVGATVTGILALQAQSTLNNMRFVGTTPSGQVTSQQSTVKAFAVTTDILAVAAIATLGTTLVLTFTRDVSSEKAPTGPAVSLGVTPAGGVLMGAF